MKVTTQNVDEGRVEGKIVSQFGVLNFNQDPVMAEDCGFQNCQDKLVLESVVVKKQHRGKGHGKALMAALIEFAKVNKYKFILLGAWPLDDRGNGLDETSEGFEAKQKKLLAYYRKLGFKSARCPEGYRMKLKLS